MVLKIKNKLKKIPYLRRGVHYLKLFFPWKFFYSKEFYEWYQFLQKSQWWSEEQHRDYQWKKIKELLEYSYINVPYYTKVFKELDASPHDFKNFRDFEEFPYLTKEIVRNHFEEFISLKVNRKDLIYYNTGGATGEPLRICKTKRDDIIGNAFMFSQWKRVGFSVKDLIVRLRGEIIPDKKLWVYQPSSNSYLFSSYHLSKKHISKFVKKLNSIKPKFLHVYPSSLWLFANIMNDNELKISFKLQGILCGSEKLYPNQRKLFEKIFGCRVYTWLGLAEQTILAGECEKSNLLHIFSEHSYVELIDSERKIIRSPGITGKIVGTTFYRYVFPFIRYISDDIAKYASLKCTCGRHYKLLENIVGRSQDRIVCKNGKIIPVTALFFGQHLKAFNNTIKLQIEQNKPGKAIVRIIKSESFTFDDEQLLNSQLKKATDGGVEFGFQYVNDIPRTASGKHKFVIQDLPIENF